jgi:hypothetical protein
MGMKLSPPLREDHRMTVFENRVLRTIFRSKRERLEKTANNIRVIKSRKVIWVGHVARG